MWPLSLVLVKPACLQSEYGTQGEANSSVGDGSSLPQAGHYGCIKSSTWGHLDCQPKCKQGHRTQVPPGLIRYPDYPWALKFFLDLPEISRTLLGRVKALGLLMFFPGEKQPEHTYIEHHSTDVHPLLPPCTRPGLKEEGYGWVRASVWPWGLDRVTYLSINDAAYRGLYTKPWGLKREDLLDSGGLENFLEKVMDDQQMSWAQKQWGPGCAENLERLEV